MLLVTIVAIPLFMTLVTALNPWRAWIGRLSAAANVAVLILGAWLGVQTMSGARVAAARLLRADSLSAVMVLVIAAVAVLATSFSAHTMGREIDAGATTRRHARQYLLWLQVFISAMLIAVLSANLGVVWVCVEATTIATTFLVSHRRTSGAFEASWKYVIICSVGIALAFLGTVLIYYAQLHAGAGSTSLNWTSLMAVARQLNPAVTRLGFAFVVLGYGTKVGLVPMHSWLPDAHSQAPAPVSALMSGVLLSVAFYALLRFRAVAELALGPSFPRTVLLIVGVASLVVATAALIAQRDLKRMLAYSSIEHMGLMAIGAAVGSPLAVAAVLLHILGHGVTKAVLFLSAGEIYTLEGSTEISELSGLLTRRPALGSVFGVGLVSLLALPPFSLFVSELTMFRAEVDAGLAWVVALSLACLAVIFASVLRHGRHVLLGARERATPADSRGRATIAVLVVALVLVAGLGLSSWPLSPLLWHAAHLVTP